MSWASCYLSLILLAYAESVANESVATESVANESVANESVANESVANESMANESVATESVANENVANESVANESVANESVANESVANESVANESVATESVANENVANESVANESVANESVANESVANESVATESVANESVANESVANESVANESVANESVTSENVTSESAANERVATSNKHKPHTPQYQTPPPQDQSTQIIDKVCVSFPTKLLIIVIYRPPGSLDHFIDELNIILSQFPIEGNPLILLGDFNLPSDKLHSSCILPMLTASDLTLNHSPPTHKAGNVLDLIFTRTTTTSDISHPPPPLRPSLSLLLSLLPSLSIQSSPTCSSSFHRNLHSITPSSLTSTILSTLPHPDSLSSLSLDAVTNSFISTLSSSVNLLCPLSSRAANSSPPAPWLTETLHCHRRELKTAERRWRKSHVDSDLSSYQSLLYKFSLEVTSAKSSYYREKFESSSDPCKLFTIFSSLLNPPRSSSLTLEDVITFFEEKVAAIHQSFSSGPTPPTNIPQHPTLTFFLLSAQMKFFNS
ncbi:hypothetical protein P4O66_001603 [Electrophorus voltai]|uniref:Endonuclease/exonuclease/phosphatase domain-containing protein n=1 Tax=Electrophorus voltai TaxID=2609070 RepID=A0AAD8Z529_9TELE|nr:hypothetical protein P4O66_001603 [Electrophorus voltai]